MDGRHPETDATAMGLFDITQDVLDRALSGSALRQSVLANNVANANTAGYKRSDVDFQSTLAQALDSGEAAPAVRNLTFAPQTDTTATMRLDGNSVDMDSEMAKLSENSVGYQALISIAHARLQMIQTAIGSK
jgi:flagellar basal-body rod protein FlgB